MGTFSKFLRYRERRKEANVVNVEQFGTPSHSLFISTNFWSFKQKTKIVEEDGSVAYRAKSRSISLHDKTTIKINGMTINAGDDIVVKPLFGKWLLGTFKYYDPIDKVYYYDGDCWSYSYKILPATEQNRQFIGKY